MDPQDSSSEDAPDTLIGRATRAAREIYHWSKLSHRNVLPLMGLAVFRGNMSMVSEWMNNGDLMSYIRLNPDVNRLSMCIGVCEGLRYIHARGMAHGDLKAANVLVSDAGTPKIADFGSAQLKDLTLKFTNTTTRSHSVRWTAPELLRDDNDPQASKEADVYAYGMTALEILTGKIPFDGIGENRVILLVAYENRPPPRPDADISDDLWGILGCCWTQEPAERPKIDNIGDRIRPLITIPSDPIIAELTGGAVGAARSRYTGATKASDSGEVLTILQRARCSLALSDTSTCLAALRDLPDSTPGVADVRRRAEQLDLHVRRFKDARGKDEWGDARLALEQATETLGCDIPVHWRCWKIECEVARGDWEAAEAGADDLLQLAPEVSDALSLSGLVMFLTNQIPRAIQLAQQALLLGPSQGSARELLRRAREIRWIKEEANEAFQEGRLDEAVEWCGEALEVLGQRASEGGGGRLRAILLSNRATARFKLGRLALALEDVNASLSLDPCSYGVLRTRARIHVELEHFADAIRDYGDARAYAEGQGVDPGELQKLIEETEKAGVILNRRQIEYYYKVLGLSGDCTDAELKKAYRRESMIYHPSRGGDGEKFKLVAEAHTALSDPQRRQRHDTGVDKSGQMDSLGKDSTVVMQDNLAEMLAQMQGGRGALGGRSYRPRF